MSSYDIDWFAAPDKGIGGEIRAGSLYWAPIPFHWQDEQVWHLRLEYESRADPAESQYRIQATNIRDYDMEVNPPLRPLKIPSDQIVIAAPYKIRPAIAITGPGEIWRDGTRQGDDVVIALPITAVRNQIGEYRYSEPFLLKVQALTYPSLFHLPESACGRCEEGLVRFDWAHAIPACQLKPFHHDYHRMSLGHDAFWLISVWFSRYLGLPLRDDDEEILEDYRADKRQRLDEYLGSL
jgi:hypothetical protein